MFGKWILVDWESDEMLFFIFVLVFVFIGR